MLSDSDPRPRSPRRRVGSVRLGDPCRFAQPLPGCRHPEVEPVAGEHDDEEGADEGVHLRVGDADEIRTRIE